MRERPTRMEDMVIVCTTIYAGGSWERDARIGEMGTPYCIQDRQYIPSTYKKQTV